MVTFTPTLSPIVCRCKKISEWSLGLAVGGSAIKNKERLLAHAANCSHSHVIAMHQSPASDWPWMHTVCVQGRSLVGNCCIAIIREWLQLTAGANSPPFLSSGLSPMVNHWDCSADLNTSTCRWAKMQVWMWHKGSNLYQFQSLMPQNSYMMCRLPVQFLSASKSRVCNCAINNKEQAETVQSWHICNYGLPVSSSWKTALARDTDGGYRWA